MLKHTILSVLFIASAFQCLFAQADPVLFTVGGEPVYQSEFEYIYAKTNGDKADFSRASLEEYLDLYVKFKLKVAKARQMRLDTLPGIKGELAGYRKQLADSYLLDKTVKNRLLREAYERQKEDVNISHIMVVIRGRRSPKDTLDAYKKIVAIEEALEEGQDFAEVAKQRTEDSYSKKTGGLIGWVTAVLPNGFYEMENAAYETPVGKYSKIFRTSRGYHILKVNDKRPARGSIELAQIMVFDDGKDKAASEKAKAAIDMAFADLQAGGDFDQIARKVSQDKKSAAKGGYLGFFGIGKSERVFEDAAFALAKDGDYSAPVRSSTGWHIIKRVGRPEMGSFDAEKSRLQSKVEKDARFEEAREAMMQRIKLESNYTVDREVLEGFTKGLGEEFLGSKWKAPKKSKEALFTFDGKKTYDLGGFTDFLLRSVRKRMSLGRKNKADKVVDILLEEYSNNMAMNYEKTRLADKYPDFRALMREYEEGIILFEVTKGEVWDKAAKDSTGLQNYFEAHRGDYLWSDRAEVTTYTLNSQSEQILAKSRKLARKKGKDAVLSKINKKGNLLVAVSGKAEKGKKFFTGLDGMEWKKGMLSPNQINGDNTVSFVKLERILPRERKELEDARGYVIADYQNELEARWLEELRKEFPVKINDEVLREMIK